MVSSKTFKVGSGSLQYELVEGWERIPAGYRHADVAGVCTDSQGNVYLFCRGDHPVMIYDRDGHFLDAWGEGQFSYRTHGMHMAPDNWLFLVDDSRHKVGLYTFDGQELFELGPAEHPSDTGDYDGRTPASVTKAGGPFNRPTNVAVAPNGDLFVSDGYGNTRVHRFSSTGKLLSSWGEPGTGPGQFMLPHGIAVDPTGNVLVCDRESDRIQFFTAEGRFIREITEVQRPTQIALANGLMFVSELGWRAGQRSFRHGPIERDLPSRVSVLDANGTVVARIGGPDPCAPGSFCAPHGLAVDSNGDLYVAEVVWGNARETGAVPPECPTVQKLQRID